MVGVFEPSVLLCICPLTFVVFVNDHFLSSSVFCSWDSFLLSRSLGLDPWLDLSFWQKEKLCVWGGGVGGVVVHSDLHLLFVCMNRGL